MPLDAALLVVLRLGVVVDFLVAALLVRLVVLVSALLWAVFLVAAFLEALFVALFFDLLRVCAIKSFCKLVRKIMPLPKKFFPPRKPSFIVSRKYMHKQQKTLKNIDMKKILFALMLTLPLAGFAQELEGFWGLNFSSSNEKVQEIVKQRSGKAPIEGSNETVLAYRNCDFGGNKAYLVQLYFFNNKLYGGDITVTPAANEAYEIYGQIVDEISHKYQENVKGTEQVTAVYESGSVNWSFTNSMSEICATIENGVIRISYRDGYISGQKTAAIEDYRNRDY